MNTLYRHILGDFLISKSGEIQRVKSKTNSKIKELNAENHSIKEFEKISEYIFLNHKDELYNIIINKTKEKLSKLSFDDDYIIQAINAVDELDKTINMLSKRLRRFILTYLPEINLSKIDNERLCFLLASQSRGEILESEGISQSMGSNIPEETKQIIKDFASTILKLFEMRKKLLSFIVSQEEKIMKNFAAIAGPTIAARLLSKAGSIKNLVNMPASTIQILGAEKALFRHLVKGKKSPKYGILYQHPLVQKVKSRYRGKMARIIADKLAIGIKVDYFDNKDISKELLDEIQKRYEECR